MVKHMHVGRVAQAKVEIDTMDRLEDALVSAQDAKLWLYPKRSWKDITVYLIRAITEDQAREIAAKIYNEREPYVYPVEWIDENVGVVWVAESSDV